MNKELQELVRKWRLNTDEGDRLFDLPRQRTNARVRYLQADHFARKAMEIIEKEKTPTGEENE